MLVSNKLRNFAVAKHKPMSNDILESVSQRSDGTQDAENCRISAIANELQRLCAIYEAQPGDGQSDVSYFEKEQRAAAQLAKADGYYGSASHHTTPRC